MKFSGLMITQLFGGRLLKQTSNASLQLLVHISPILIVLALSLFSFANVLPVSSQILAKTSVSQVDVVTKNTSIFVPVMADGTFVRGTNSSADGEPRMLDITGENVERQVVDSYFTFCNLYGPTMQFYHMPGQNAVIHVLFSNSDLSFEPEISIHLFDESLSDEKIREWINNQHSDAIFPEVPEPIYTETLEETERTLNEVNYVERIVGQYGQEYADYQVNYSVGDLTVPDQFQLTGFEQVAKVHIQTKACFVAQAAPRERELDVTSDDTDLFTVDRYFSLCQYGPTQQFFDFGEENTVMVVLFNTGDPDFEPTITVNIFSPELDGMEIDKWINNQHSDGLYADAPAPVSIVTLAPADYSITSSTLIDQTVGTAGDEYDNYRVQYSVNDVVDSGNFQLTQFDSETVVHIETKACGS